MPLLHQRPLDDAPHQVTWPLLPNPPGDVGSLYGVQGTPTNVFVDRRGVIRAIALGPQTVAQFQANAQDL
jgi:hypothetical protein